MFINEISNKIAGIDLIIKNGKHLEIKPFHRCIVIALATLGSLLIYAISQILFTSFSKTYRYFLIKFNQMYLVINSNLILRNLVIKERMFWNLATVRGFYGFFGTIFSIYVRYFEPDLR